MGFDLATLLNAEFPRALCPRCGAISSGTINYRVINPPRELICRVCHQRWKRTNSTSTSWREFFEGAGCAVVTQDPIAHAQRLAEVVHNSRMTSPMNTLFQLMARTEHFLHITTWNTNDMMLGTLAMLATRVHVRGIVGTMDERQRQFLETLRGEIPNLDLVVHGDKGAFDAPHTKLLVFDGLIAIEGSANFTVNAWVKAAANKERIRFVTDLQEVVDLNNNYFSSHWRNPDPIVSQDEVDELAAAGIPF